MNKYIVYIASVSVFIISISVTILLPINEVSKIIITTPGAVALLTILFQLFRDSETHRKNLDIQNKEQDYVLGTASHMANIAYDKHVLFCEEYMARVQSGFQELLREGPSKNAMNIGRELVNIRQKHSPWLTKNIEQNLIPFESALIKIGAKERVVDMIQIGEQRNQMIDDIFKSFGLILGHEKAETEEEANIAIEKIIEKIREILGINILTELRLKIADVALKRLN